MHLSGSCAGYLQHMGGACCAQAVPSCAGQKVQVTTTGQRTSTGRLVRGWQPELATDMSLLLRVQPQQGPSAPRLLELAADACGALTVQWEAAPDHLTLMCPWEVSLQYTEQSLRRAGQRPCTDGCHFACAAGPFWQACSAVQIGCTVSRQPLPVQASCLLCVHACGSLCCWSRFVDQA